MNDEYDKAVKNNHPPKIGDTVRLSIEGVVTNMSLDGKVKEIGLGVLMGKPADYYSRFWLGNNDNNAYTVEVIARKPEPLPTAPGSQMMALGTVYTKSLNGFWYNGNTKFTPYDLEKLPWELHT